MKALTDSPEPAPMSREATFAADVVARYQDLAVVDTGRGDVIHDGLKAGAFAGYFDPNTGGFVWLSHSLHRVGDQVLHVVAGSDTVAVFRSLHPTCAEAAARALHELCGEDQHLMIAEGGYVLPEGWPARPQAMDAILARFRERCEFPDRPAAELLQLPMDATRRRWLECFIEQRVALCGGAPDPVPQAGAHSPGTWSTVQAMPAHSRAPDERDAYLMIGDRIVGVLWNAHANDERAAADARRVVASGNACAPYDTHGLERDGVRTLLHAAHQVVLSAHNHRKDLDKRVEDMQDTIVDLCEPEQVHAEPGNESEPEGMRP